MTVYQTVVSEIKNSNATGAYIQPIPIGVLVTLDYSDKGILTKMTYESNGETVEVPFELTVKLAKENIIIQRLQTYKSACKVFGVLVAPLDEIKFNKCAGMLPECCYPALLKLANSNPKAFKFYAIDLKLADNKTLPATAALNRLAMMKFDLVTGIVASSVSQPAQALMQLRSIANNVQPSLPLLLGFYVHGVEHSLRMSRFLCGKVSKYTKSMDINGYIHGKLKCDLGNGSSEVCVSYNQIVKHHLADGSFVVLDEYNNIEFVSQPKLFSRIAPTTVTCPVCGKKYTVNEAEDTVSCVDPHCASKLYPQICRMLARLKLHKLPPEKFNAYLKSGEIKTLQDVFNLEEYKGCEIDTTLTALIEAITPVELLAGDVTNIAKFVHQASSPEAVSYYIHSPSQLDADLKVTQNFANRFKEYWSDPYNMNTYDTFIDLPCINVITSEKKFDGDFIFRNKLICLTGEFKHGSYDDIVSILKSYAGTSTVEFTPQVSFVLVGHFGTPDPYIIERARAYSIPIYEELDFFKAYEIDKDLESRHLI